jgi:RHS repeat-associated protein
MRDSTGSTDRDTLYVFDRAGQRTRTTTPAGVIDTGWDLAGNLHELTQPDGTQFRYTHLPTGQIDEFSGYSSGAGVFVSIASYGYDDDGIETSEWIYGAGGSSRSHLLNAAGKTATFAEAMRKPDTTWENYTSVLGYRADQRLGTEQVNGGTTATMSYDDAGQLTAQSGDDPVTYAYGTRGNRTASSAGSDTTTYTTNPNGSIASTTTGSTVVTYDYDDAGRRTAATTKVSGATTRTVATTYDARGKPAMITDTRGSDVITEERSYDGGAQLTDITITGGDSAGTFEINWDTTAAIPRMSEMRRDGAVWVRLDNANTLLAFDAVWGPVWYKLDARSSVINPDDNYLNAPGPTSYDPFGKRSGAPYFWAGYRSEPHFGDLIHLRNRDYDPTIGQFTTQDELDGVEGTPTAANPFHYVDNEPYGGIDPLGLKRLSDDGFDGGKPQCRGTIPVDTHIGTPGTIGPFPVPPFVPDIGIGYSGEITPEPMLRLLLYSACLQNVSHSPKADFAAGLIAIPTVRESGSNLDLGCATGPRGITIACVSNSRQRAPGLVVNGDAKEFTQGHFIFCRLKCEGSLLEHELVHVAQWERYGDSFSGRYIAASISDPGNECANKYEVEAYEKNNPCPH